MAEPDPEVRPDPKARPEGPLYHLALADEWAEALESGEYLRSTVGRSLEDEGFIHTSFADQVRATADAYYRDRRVVLLVIDPGRVPSPVVLEPIGDGRLFPHVYGPLPTSAVLEATPVPLGDDGRLRLDGLVQAP